MLSSGPADLTAVLTLHDQHTHIPQALHEVHVQVRCAFSSVPVDRIIIIAGLTLHDLFEIKSVNHMRRILGTGSSRFGCTLVRVAGAPSE